MVEKKRILGTFGCFNNVFRVLFFFLVKSYAKMNENKTHKKKIYIYRNEKTIADFAHARVLTISKKKI